MLALYARPDGLTSRGGDCSLDEIAHIVYTVACAEVAELADAHDSKSCGLCPCGFDSHLRHYPVGQVASRCPCAPCPIFVETSMRRALLAIIVGLALGVGGGLALGWTFPINTVK